jgi:hypothetical protein
MKEIYTTIDHSTFYLVRSFLESNGIACEVRNDLLYPIAGEIPFDNAWPKLFVKDDAQEIEAKKLVREFLDAQGATPSFCPACDADDTEMVSKAGPFAYGRFRCRTCGHEWRPGR